ncbi:MAG: hypothetical protein HY671_08285, partial [Chloroflexi bacterium]|nr:hypothetical protein [Chloroflexota bacterium]
IPTLRDPAPVVPGLYRTAVNIHNFWEKETTFLQKVAIALPQDQERGPVTTKVKTSLRSNEAVEVDCYNVVAILEGTNSAKAEFLKGFVVIESPVELEVTAVYTAEELQEKGISIDVEQIQPHVIKQAVPPPPAGCTPSGGRLTNGTGIATGAPIILGAANTITATAAGTFTITLPAGVTGTAVSGLTGTIFSSPVALPAGAATVITATVGTFAVNLSCP